MAALGMLSAEVSHEVNTPLGISITSASYLLDTLTQLQANLKQKKLSKQTIENFILNANQSTELLITNLNRASELVTSFKHVAVDQTSDKIRLINVAQYLDEIIQSLHPKLKHTNHCVKVHCDKSIEIYSHPGAIAQIIINLVINSILHGFEDINRGEINIDIALFEQKLHLNYKDNGHGLSAEVFKNLFIPFYTTKANNGGTGLGTHIINNLVIDTLNGTIEASSEENQGLSYHIIIPDMRS